MKSWIIQEDLSREYQKAPTEFYKNQTICNRADPPRK